jgi:hypothetical protein
MNSRRLTAICLFLSLGSAMLPSQVVKAAADQTPANALSGASASSNPLNLTDDQQKRIAAIKQAFLDQAKLIAKDTTLTPGQQKAKIADMATRAITDIQACLTASQRAKANSIDAKVTKTETAKSLEVASLRQRIKQDGVDYIANRTSLVQSVTAEQKQKINNLEALMNADVAALNVKTTLTQAQKDARILELKHTYDTRRLTIFTPKQLALFAKLDKISTDGENAQAEINRLDPVLIISPKP